MSLDERSLTEKLDGIIMEADAWQIFRLQVALRSQRHAIYSIILLQGGQIYEIAQEYGIKGNTLSKALSRIKKKLIAENYCSENAEFADVVWALKKIAQDRRFDRDVMAGDVHFKEWPKIWSQNPQIPKGR